MEFVSLAQPARSLFWTAQVSDDGEMNTEDPLGLDYVAQQIGLLLLPALTTRSTRAQAYAVVLYGLDLAEKAVEHYGLPNTDEQKRALFERWERFWALATLEHRGGLIPRGDWDSMRGIRGAKGAWRRGEDKLPLDYPLISRQQELGSLGAYLVPLRRSGLVVDGGIRPTPAALEILENFWDEASDNSHLSRYDNYALAALDPQRPKIERSYGNLTLDKVGQRSRLLSLIHLRREKQQRRLHDALFERARDATTRAIAALVERATADGVTSPRAILSGAIDGQWGDVGALRDLLLTARAFGDFMHELIRVFDRLYDAIDGRGWVATRAQVLPDAFPQSAHAALTEASRVLLDAPAVSEIGRFPMHGRNCLRLASELAHADAATGLDLVLRYHATVQRDRSRGAGWISDEAGKLVLNVTSYSARPEADRFPSYKLGAVRTLLTDTGRLPFNAAEPVAEVGA